MYVPLSHACSPQLSLVVTFRFIVSFIPLFGRKRCYVLQRPIKFQKYCDDKLTQRNVEDETQRNATETNY